MTLIQELMNQAAVGGLLLIAPFAVALFGRVLLLPLPLRFVYRRNCWRSMGYQRLQELTR